MVGLAAWVAPSGAAAQWTQLGGSLNTATRSADAVTRVDASGAPVVAWVESAGSGTGKLLVARWTGNAWSRFGSSLNTSDPTIGRGALQLDAGGMPVVAWTEGTSGIVARWDGTQWRRLGSFANVMNALISVVSADPVLVAHFDSNRQLALDSWTGSAWSRIATRALPGYSVSFPLSYALDSSGSPVVAWQGLRPSGGSSDWDLVTERWNSGAWSRLGGVLNVNPAYGVGSADLETSGSTLAVAWNETFFRQPGATYVAQWNGSSWQQLGSFPSAGPAPTLALDAAGIPDVAVTEATGNLAVRRWNGSGWDSLAGAVNPSGTTSIRIPALVASGPAPVVSWIGVPTNSGSGPLIYQVFVNRLDDQAGTTTTTAATTTSVDPPASSTTTTSTTTTSTTTTSTTTTTTTAPTSTTTTSTTTTSTTTTAAPTTTTTTVPAQSNLVPNPGFETTAIPSDYWGGALARSTTIVRSGAAALTQTLSSSSGGWDLDENAAWQAPVTPGGHYTAAIWVRASATTKVRVVADLLRANGGFVDESQSGWTTVPVGTWTRLTVPVTATTSTARIALQLNFSAGLKGTVLAFDDMTLTTG